MYDRLRMYLQLLHLTIWIRFAQIYTRVRSGPRDEALSWDGPKQRAGNGSELLYCVLPIYRWL